MMLVGFFIYPISEHSFTIKAIKKMYYAKSKENIFHQKSKNKEKEHKKRYCGIDPKTIPPNLKERLD